MRIRNKSRRKITLLGMLLISVPTYATSLSTLLNDKSQSVIIADKTNGKIVVWTSSTQTVTSNPALFGKTISDVYDINAYNKGGKPDNVTPSGVFHTAKYYSQSLHKPVTAFVEGNETFVAIHPVWTGSTEQRRLDRLESPSPEDNRITNGCINVTTEFYYEVIDKLKTGTRLVVLKEGDILIDDITFSSIPSIE